jgi:hypothetical protein
LQHDLPVKRLALLIPLSAGCFYIDPINQRPSVAIEAGSSDPVFRGSAVHLHALVDDPEGDEDRTTLGWTVLLCTDATSPSGCDPGAPFFTGANPDADFTVPIVRADNATPVTSLFVELDATDPDGASARPPAQLVIAVGDHPPDLALSTPSSKHHFVVGAPVDVFAKVSDVDDVATTADLARITSDIEVVSKPVVTSMATLGSLVEQAEAGPPPDKIISKTFTPANSLDSVGFWTLQITATDPSQVTSMQLVTIGINADHPPCLAAFEPIVPPPGSTLPVFEPTLFSIPIVTDDLDVYPPRTDDDLFGTTQFAWSLLPPGASLRQPAGAASTLAFDPKDYHAGDIVEIRVEIFDRKNTPINCADSDPTCSVISDDSCIQRQTWRVEVQ